MNWLKDLWIKVKAAFGVATPPVYAPGKDGPTRTQVAPEAPPLPSTPIEVIIAESDVPPMEMIFPYLDRAIAITGPFEGAGYSNISNDFDQQGISAGILQWCFGQGSLQNVILKKYIAKHGSIDKLGIFPSGVKMDEIAKLGPAQALVVVRRNMLNGVNVKSDWLAAWKKFMLLPAVIILQKDGCAAVAKGAKSLCEQWGMEGSERAFCFFFDIVTQNGSMRTAKRRVITRGEAQSLVGKANEQCRRIWAPLIASASQEQMILLAAAFDRASTSRVQYFHDVYARKGTIALGSGFVHGRRWDLFPTGA